MADTKVDVYQLFRYPWATIFAHIETGSLFPRIEIVFRLPGDE